MACASCLRKLSRGGRQDVHNQLALLLTCEALLFVLTMSFASSKRFALAGEYVGTGFHLLLMPVIFLLTAPLVGIAAGFLWVACDVIASTGLIWNRASPGINPAVFTPIRMAGHLFAGIWIAAVSLQLDVLSVSLGFLLAVSFATYTLAGGRLPDKFLAAPGLLMLIWLLLLSWRAHQGSLVTVASRSFGF